eukprot:s313_g19.t3
MTTNLVLSEDVSSLRAEIAELGKQIQIAGQTRQKENAKFQTEATEQSQTQMILKKAVQFLRKFYSSASLVQIRRHGKDEPGPALGNPEGFQDYQKNAGGEGVISLIETIAEDAHKLEMEAIQDEQDSQATYEDFTAQTSATIKAKQSEVDGKMKEILLCGNYADFAGNPAFRQQEMAEAKNDKAEAESSRESTLSELDELFEAKMALHKECDFFVKNFEAKSGGEIKDPSPLQVCIRGGKPILRLSADGKHLEFLEGCTPEDLAPACKALQGFTGTFHIVAVNSLSASAEQMARELCTPPAVVWLDFWSSDFNEGLRVQIEDLTAGYGNAKSVLHGISLNVAPRH